MWTRLGCAIGCLVAGSVPAGAQQIDGAAGWAIGTPTAGTHRVSLDLASPRTGRGCGKITGTTAEGGARACFIQEFYQKTAIPPGRPYQYSVAYRTEQPLEGTGSVLIDAYGKEGEKSRQQLASVSLAAAPQWQTVSGQVEVPATAVRVRLLLYLRGRGTIWYDDAFFGEVAADAPNRLRNGGLEPPASVVYDLAPDKPTGQVRFSCDFENGVLGAVKEIGPDEYYVHAFSAGQPHSPFLWFHFRVDGVAGREITFHLNPAPFDRDRTGGSGSRLPVVSYDGDTWSDVADKSWNEDGSALTFRLRFTQSPAWIASFFPFTPQHVDRFIAAQRGCRWFATGTLGRTAGGRDLRTYTITDPDVPEAQKRTVLFITLQHDLETTGAMALEGLCRFLLGDDPRAAALRRALVVHVVPIMDLDGLAQGNLYCPVGNLNRQWGLGTAPETTQVEGFAKRLAARGQPLDLFMDFHGWCTPERTTLFMTFGKEIADAASEADAVRLATTIGARLTGKVSNPVWRHMTENVTNGQTDLRRLSAGWMKFEAGARLAYSIEIFGEGECDQDGYWRWGQAFAEGLAEFYGLP